MKKCGILTFQFAHNYGAQLQAYALKEQIKKLNCNVEIINYGTFQTTNVYKLFKFPKKNGIAIIRELKNSLFRKTQYDLFIEFAKTEMNFDIRKAKDDELDNTSDYDCIVVGSDQVWNKKITGADNKYFLENVDNSVNKVAYSASIGIIDDDNKFNSLEIEEIEQFDHISVREKDAKEYLESIVKKPIFQTVDPVFLLEKYQWKKMWKIPNKLPEKYIAVCTLKYDSELQKEIEKLEKKMQIPAFCIHPLAWKQKKGKQLYNIGPREFLWFIGNAEIVVTNSFHAAAFSVIFGRRLVYNNIETKNSRITSLLELCGHEENKAIEIIDTKQLDFRKLNEMITESKEYLCKAILEDKNEKRA